MSSMLKQLGDDVNIKNGSVKDYASALAVLNSGAWDSYLDYVGLAGQADKISSQEMQNLYGYLIPVMTTAIQSYLDRYKRVVDPSMYVICTKCDKLVKAKDTQTKAGVYVCNNCINGIRVKEDVKLFQVKRGRKVFDPPIQYFRDTWEGCRTISDHAKKLRVSPPTISTYRARHPRWKEGIKEEEKPTKSKDKTFTIMYNDRRTGKPARLEIEAETARLAIKKYNLKKESVLIGECTVETPTGEQLYFVRPKKNWWLMK